VRVGKQNLEQNTPPGRGDSDNLRWQSWLVLGAVVPWCALAALRYVLAAPSGAIRAGVVQTALGLSLLLALLVFLARAATALAALVGGLITLVLTLAPLPSSGSSSWYHSALLPLLTLFVLTWAATRFGVEKKLRMGVAEDKRGRNGAQVAANLGVAALGAAAALSPSWTGSSIHPIPATFYAVIVAAALAEATADTVASELGEVLGGPPFLLTTLRRVAPGTDGAISFAGTVAGTGGAALAVLVAVSTLGLRVGDAISAGVGAVGGLFVDSLLGATAERRGWLNNDAVNFLSTLAASVIAIAIALLGWSFSPR
jgi:uncharacterized protein (TIGR00297 family)